MRRILTSTLIGLCLSAIAFAAVGWIVCSVMWRIYGLDKIPPDSNPGVALGGYAAVVQGLICGGVFGILTFAFVSWRLYRRDYSR
jgi:hypothetical protein